MYHGLTNQFLYTAHKISVVFRDHIGNTKTGSGTCFVVVNKFGKPVLVTNRHMLDIQYGKKNSAFEEYKLVKITLSGKRSSSQDKYPLGDAKWELDDKNIVFSKNEKNDIACIKNLTASNPSNISYYLTRDLLATKEDFENNLNACDFLAFPGFPEWHDKRDNRPIMRTGTISSDPRFPYFYSKGDGSFIDGECVAYEAFSYSGSSGSPVFAVQKGPQPGVGISFPGFRRLMCVGINAGHINVKKSEGDPKNEGVHSGISYFYKSSAILDLIDDIPEH